MGAQHNRRHLGNLPSLLLYLHMSDVLLQKEKEAEGGKEGSEGSCGLEDRSDARELI